MMGEESKENRKKGKKDPEMKEANVYMGQKKEMRVKSKTGGRNESILKESGKRNKQIMVCGEETRREERVKERAQ